MKDGRRDRGPNVPSGIKLRDNGWDEKTQASRSNCFLDG